MGTDRAQKDQGGHPEGNPTARLMNFVHDQVISRVGWPSKMLVSQYNNNSSQRQAEKQPGVRKPEPGRLIQHPQKERHHRTDHGRHGSHPQRPFQCINQQRKMFFWVPMKRHAMAPSKAHAKSALPATGAGSFHFPFSLISSTSRSS